MLQRLPAVALHNRYGPTETAITVTHWQCRAEDGERSPIGRPLGNVLAACWTPSSTCCRPASPASCGIGGSGPARGLFLGAWR